jgi:hypothetical protein
VVSAFPRKGGGRGPGKKASLLDWAVFLAREKNRARRRDAQG